MCVDENVILVYQVDSIINKYFNRFFFCMRLVKLLCFFNFLYRVRGFLV